MSIELAALNFVSGTVKTPAPCALIAVAFTFFLGSARPALAGEAVPQEQIESFESLVRQTAGAGVRVTLAGVEVRCEIDVDVLVPSAPTDASEKQTFAVLATVMPYLDSQTQRARLATALRVERAAWHAVASLECDGKEFSDVYRDGLCFRTKTAAQKRRVATYRAAREALDRVPRYHLGHTISVAIRVLGGEPTDGTCGQPCRDLNQRIAGLLVEYPSRAD